MSLNKYKIIIILTVLSLILGTNYLLLGEYFKANSEEFFSLYTLDKDGKTNNYFIEDSNIILGSITDWTVTVENNMGRTQYVKILIKIFNSSNMNKNIYTCIPNPSPIVYQNKYTIIKDEVWEHNIKWYINNIEIRNNITEIKEIVINEQSIPTSILSKDGKDFIFLIELWVYDLQSDEFLFTWGSDDLPDCTWNNIWFDVVE